MTVVKILDASAVAAIIFNEPEKLKVGRSLVGCHLAAPTLLRQELASVARKKTARFDLDPNVVQMTMYHFSNWEIEWYGVPASKSYETSRATGLSAYDATYAWLAWELNAELITLDIELNKAVNKN